MSGIPETLSDSHRVIEDDSPYLCRKLEEGASSLQTLLVVGNVCGGHLEGG